MSSVTEGMKNKSPVETSDISTTDHKLTVVVEVLKEVLVITISTVKSLLSLISIPWLDQKSTKGSFRSKFFSSGGRKLYEICDETALQSAKKRLEAVEIAIEDLEAELDCIFRRLIQTRSSCWRKKLRINSSIKFLAAVFLPSQDKNLV
ncbi:hypothetical protein GH714_007115 [Hevea brasiliensis]|uniref:Uncharacterized protein n=1 Tax=Hevea brasiliensis TaxID=3981 RepID=A0A6A6MD91_HEVBR|nr:hypothetical protein GH714_007115 [Hevea brasiliensis]